MTLGRVLKHCIKKYERRFFIGVRIFNVWRRNRELTRRCFLANYYIIEYYIMFPNGRKIWHKYGTNC